MKVTIGDQKRLWMDPAVMWRLTGKKMSLGLFQEEQFDNRLRGGGWDHYEEEGRSPELPASAVM